MNSARKSLQVAGLAFRQLGTTAARREADKPSQAFYKLKAKQERFQVQDGKPVHLKGGIMDKFLYQLTGVLCLVAFGMTGKLYYDLAMPSKN